MSNFRMPKGRILFLMSLVYLFAFASLYVQLPGLYSRNGILPVDKLALSPMVKWQDFLTNPSLLRISHLVQLDQYDALELVTLLGTLIALLATLFGTFRTMSSFIVLWLFYFACYQSGQVFMHFQWDILLLEAGFLTILLAGADIFFVIPLPKHVASDRLALYMMKWLLFRLMFASGVVKLISECPAWWSLKALNYHFETQCIPTPVAFWAHALPEWLLKLGVVLTFYVEILVPFFFFVPLRMIRKFSFYSQVLLQLAIMLTGNYNFFNLLTITLCYSLLTDCDFSCQRPVVQYTAPKRNDQQSKKQQKDQKKTKLKPEVVLMQKADCSRWSCLLSLLLIVASLVATGLLFRVRLSPDQTHLQSEIAFDKKMFDSVLTPIVQYSCYCSLLGFLFVFYLSLRDSIRQSSGCLSTSYQLLGLVTVAAIAAPLMLASTTEFALGIQPAVAKSLPTPFHRVRSQLEPWQVTSHYGLFRRMTTKRNELVVEYAQSEQGPWESVVFHHKPGPENAAMPSIVAPHQPRLDWQMWFAALSDQPPAWLYSLVRGLLAGHEEIRQLVRWPANKQAPKFIRVSRFEAHFQPAKSLSVWPGQFWQTKRLSSDHVPVCSLDTPLLKTQLTKAGLWAATKPSQPSRNALLANLLRDTRNRIGQPRDIYPLLGVVLLILLTKRFLLRH